MNKILVTGGTGMLGRVVVNKLLKANQRVIVLSSGNNAIVPAAAETHKGDLANVDDLYEAVDGVRTIVHCASNPRNFQAVDVTGTKNLLSTISENNSVHVIYISIVGIHKSEYPYYKAKLEVEKMIARSGNPFTILRTTQFHGFVYKMIETSTVRDGNALTIPSGMRFQSVDISEVAHRLVSLCTSADYGLLDDFGGPEVMTFEEMVRLQLEISEQDVQIESEDIPGFRYALFRSGVNLCREKAVGKITWAEFLGQYRR